MKGCRIKTRVGQMNHMLDPCGHASDYFDRLQVNVTRYFLRCVADYCTAAASGTAGRDDVDEELEMSRCVGLSAYSHECTHVSEAGVAWRTEQLCREYYYII